eukprot:c2028_g1_i1.p1 GENE.c2028_g1_i1~~c2028_g1_i1.p1  ORF type:complete len:440 (-),score=105.08 c2028_g1_i1:283-1602(-)
MKWAIIVLVLGMLLTGSINTVSKKMGYNTCSTGLDHVDATSDTYKDCHSGQRKFQKPWTQTLVMFLGESMCMLLFFYNRYRARSRQQVYAPFSERQPLLARPHNPESSEHSAIKFSSIWACFLPALCDLGGTTLSGVGLLFTTASVFQMLRGSIIVFTATFSIIFLKRKVLPFQWFGIAVTVSGIALVGTASYLHSSSSSSSASMVMIGNLLVILSQIMSATQMVIEEKFLKSKKLPPEFVVGCEGLFGVIAMLCVVLPIVYNIPFKTCTQTWCQDGEGIHENALDAWALMTHSPLLFSLVALYWVSIAFYNFCGLAVAKKLSAVHRTLVDACRTVVVWVVDLALYYITSGQYGEEWVTSSGLLQLTGFCLMVFGALTYNKVIRLPCMFAYPDPDPATPASGETSASQTPNGIERPLSESAAGGYRSTTILQPRTQRGN